MTPEERRARAEHLVKMAERGFIVEPPEDHEEWRRQFAREAKAPRTARVRADGKNDSKSRSA